MKKVSSIEGHGERSGSVVVEIHVDIKRELSEEEQNFINRHTNEIYSLLHTNSYRTHPDTITQISEEKRKLLACFPEGMAVYVRPVDNGYYKDNVIPWYEVTTPLGIIVIGWRKRVISIDWTKTYQSSIANVLFPDEEVTKDGWLIHAYGYEKAKEYLAKILNKPA